MKTKQQKHKEALLRNKMWSKLPPAQQLAYLDTNKLVATKQRKKIAAKAAQF